MTLGSDLSKERPHAIPERERQAANPPIVFARDSESDDIGHADDRVRIRSGVAAKLQSILVHRGHPVQNQSLSESREHNVPRTGPAGPRREEDTVSVADDGVHAAASGVQP